MRLPFFQSDNKELTLMQTRWSSILEPIISNPANNSVLLKNIVLSSSSVINHGLGRALQGWQLVRLRGKADVYDIQDTNTTPDLTLLLKSSSGVVADILCF